jgi:DNA phosphorothioation-associated putative methyltransferase
VTRPPRKDLPRPAVGKRVGGSLYVHKDALPLLSDLVQIVETAERRSGESEWNVAKIEKTSVSLLLYEPFDVDFPALLASTKVVLPEGRITRSNYAQRANPPILHRKELLLPPTDPRLPRFRALTQAAEDHGLFANANRIGTRAAWNTLIANAGLVLHNGRLVPANEKIDVARHKTAIVRRDLSQPMQLMMRLGIVTKTRSLFDYGCGQGEDVAALSADGYKAFGWDPHHASDGVRAPADIVNLGFVLNVIEDRRERTETLKAAWHFAEKALCIAVMRYGKVSTSGWKPYGDGVLTSRGTFQKYFHQQELQDYVAAITAQNPVALAPGIVAVFRDKELEQEVLLHRHSRTMLPGHGLPKPPIRPKIARVRPSQRERLAGVLNNLRDVAFRLRRMPEIDEVSQDALNALQTHRTAWPRALEFLRDEVAKDPAFRRVMETRRNDLLVHLALMQFPGAPKYRGLPKSIQADIRAFFRSHSAAVEEGRRALFAAGDRDAVRRDIRQSVEDRLGGMRRAHWFRFRSTSLPRLPSRLRVLVGCAEVLQGGVEACDFVDIDLEAPRVAMVTCDDVEQEIPFIIERVTVDLARLKVSAARFDAQAMPVYFKSKFLAGDDPDLSGQLAADRELAATGLFEPGQAEPPWENTSAALKARQTMKNN